MLRRHGVYLLNNAVVGLIGMRYSVRRQVLWLLPNIVLVALLIIFADELPPAVALLLITLVLTIETLPRAKRNAKASAAQ